MSIRHLLYRGTKVIGCVAAVVLSISVSLPAQHTFPAQNSEARRRLLTESRVGAGEVLAEADAKFREGT